MERFYGHICLDYSGGLYPVLSRNISRGGGYSYKPAYYNAHIDASYELAHHFSHIVSPAAYRPAESHGGKGQTLPPSCRVLHCL